MTNQVEFKEYIKAQVENILLEEDSLIRLKETINQLVNNKITPKQMRQVILEQRFEMLELITDLFPFFVQNLEQKRHLRTKEANEVEEQLKKTVEEREDLLTEVAIRLQKIKTPRKT